MDRRERRGTTATTALTACCAVLALVAGCSEADVVRAAPADPSAVLEPATPWISTPPPLRPAIDAVLEADLGAIVAEAVACAAASSGVAPALVRVSVHASDRDTGEVVVARADEVPMRPASCLKLLTTAAALVLLGPDGSLVTGFDALGPIRSGAVGGGVLEGDLVVRAGGDPIYAGPHAGEVAERLDAAAAALARLGITRIAGDLVLDLGSFPEPAPAPEWPDPTQHWQEYCALAAGLTVNAGILCTRVLPTSVGAPARIEVWPSPHGLATRYTTKTAAGSVNDVRVGATHSAVTVAGEIGISLPEVTAEFAHPDPILMFASAWCAALERAGIALAGETRRARSVEPAGERLYTLRSTLLSTLEPINAWSVNSVADQVFFATALQARGSATREAGHSAVASALERLGVSTSGFVQVDGSGLSRANRVSARQLAALLGAVLALDEKTRDAYLGSLAVAGESGTLVQRMRSGPARGRVFAKTGWIGGTSTLAGLVRSLDGCEYVFAVLVEYPASASGLNTHCFKPMHDAIAERLVLGRSEKRPRTAGQ